MHRFVLSFELIESTESTNRIADGRPFQHRGPATENARSPKRILIHRTRRSVLTSDRSIRPDAEDESQYSNRKQQPIIHATWRFMDKSDSCKAKRLCTDIEDPVKAALLSASVSRWRHRLVVTHYRTKTPIHQSIHPSVNQSVCLSVSQSVSQSINQSIDQPINQSINQTTNPYSIQTYLHTCT